MKLSKICLATLLAFSSLDALAGGLFTNTNQNPIFYRQPAQNAVVGVQGAYFNPAGLALMENGWHFYVGNQMAFQSRQITSTYAPFTYGAKNEGSATKQYEGKTFSPIIPNIDAVYRHGRWAASFHFGVISGGGSCAFNDGLGSFESNMALLPVMVNALTQSQTFAGYDADIQFTGKSFGFGGQLNFAYELIDEENSKLSVAAGLRMNYLKNAYEGGINNYSLNYGGQLVPAATAMNGVLTGILTQVLINKGMSATQAQAQAATQAATYANILGADKEVNCTQKDIAWTPILSVHYRTGIVDLAAKYEFKTKARYENSTEVNTTGMANFDDGVVVPGDIPALFSAGINVAALPALRISGGYNLYFDKSANYNGKEALLGKNTNEFLLGAEWDACKKITVSLGSQMTFFDFGENYQYLSDLSFSLNSWCLGGGLRYKFNDRVAVDLSAFKTFYSHADKTYTDYGGAISTYKDAMGSLVPEALFNALPGSGSDNFYRTSFTLGLGVAFNF